MGHRLAYTMDHGPWTIDHGPWTAGRRLGQQAEKHGPGSRDAQPVPEELQWLADEKEAEPKYHGRGEQHAWIQFFQRLDGRRRVVLLAKPVDDAERHHAVRLGADFEVLATARDRQLNERVAIERRPDDRRRTHPVRT